MTNLKTIEDVMLPMRVLNWIVGCGGIIEYPLNNPHMVMSSVYSAACALNYCLLAYLCVYYDNNKTLSKKMENVAVTSSDTLLQIFFYVNTLVTFVTIFMGWRRGKVSFCNKFFVANWLFSLIYYSYLITTALIQCLHKYHKFLPRKNCYSK